MVDIRTPKIARYMEFGGSGEEGGRIFARPLLLSQFENTDRFTSASEAGRGDSSAITGADDYSMVRGPEIRKREREARMRPIGGGRKRGSAGSVGCWGSMEIRD